MSMILLIVLHEQAGMNIIYKTIRMRLQCMCIYIYVYIHIMYASKIILVELTPIFAYLHKFTTILYIYCIYTYIYIYILIHKYMQLHKQIADARFEACMKC